MARSSRSTTSNNVKSTSKDAKAPKKTRRISKAKEATKRAVSSEDDIPDSEEDEADENVEEEYIDEDEQHSDVESLHSDALDDEDLDYSTSKKSPAKTLKRKRVVGSSKSPKKTSPRKKKKAVSNEQDSDLDLEEGQEIVGVVVQAPKTGRVPPGQISRNTFNFLSQLCKPEYNDREWFKLHEPVYRLAEKEWKDFIDEFTPMLVEIDGQIPHLPPKDVIHRIYRDIRFSNDKTPYKTGLSASFSRSGRKGVFAHYHIAIKPGNESFIAAGAWCPNKPELDMIRNNLLRSSTRLRNIISAPDFVLYFGEAKPLKDGGRQNVFGREDELKVAPKGVEKNHKDIDLLKCRSFAVAYRFTDEQVLSPDFREQLCKVARIVRPFVHCLNDLMTLPNTDGSDSDEEGSDEGEEDEE